MRVAVVAIGGALGAIARYGVAVLVARHWTRDFPLGTFVINITGCFILGFFATFAVEKTMLDPLWRLLIATGFIGAYTTFSTFEYETQQLVGSGVPAIALANVLASVLAGYAAVQLGVWMARP